MDGLPISSQTPAIVALVISLYICDNIPMTLAIKEKIPAIKPMSYELWRQDDNGNRFLIDFYADRSAAEAHLAELTRVLHKQVYWIDEKTDEESSFRSKGD